VTESKQAALAGTAVFLVLMALMLLAAMAMASPLPQPISTAVPEAEVGVVLTHDAHTAHLIKELKQTLELLEQIDSGPDWEGAGLRLMIRTSSFDMPWVWEEYPEWRLASSCTAASPLRPVGDNPVKQHPAGGPTSVAADGVSTSP
jgi:hypothetical protein